MLVDVFRWVKGYVFFSTQGGFPEKFLNLANSKKINLWDLKKFGGDLYAKTFASEYKFLKSDAKKANCEIKIIKKFGLPIFFSKYKRRIGLALGAVVFLVIIEVFSLFVWSVNVSGNKNIKSEDIIRVMKELGVGPGAMKSAVDCAMIKQLIMSKITDISWISVNISGSRLDVLLKEKIKSPEIVQEGAACNIVAKCDGQVDHTEIYKGSCCVNNGDAVVKGQILISGAARDSSGGISVSAAQGKVFANVKRKLAEKVSLRSFGPVDSGKQVKKYMVKAFGKQIPLNPWTKPSEECRVETEERSINIFGLSFPFVIHTDVCYGQVCEERFLSTEEAEKILQERICEREKTEFENSKIISKNVNKYEKDNEYVLEVTYDCLEDIAQKQEFS